MTILVNPARFRLGADTAIGRLLGDEPSGLAIDFTTMQALIRDDSFPVLGFLGDVNSLLTYTAPSPKRVFDVAGVLKFAPHNLFLNSSTPANQSVTVVSGVQYAVTLTGATVTTLSGAATGTLSAGTTVITTTTTTLTFGTTSGAGTVQVSRYPVHAGYLATTGAVRYGIPLDHDPVTHEPLGVLLEPLRINSVLRSQEFGTTWVPLNATVTSDVATSPEGMATGDRLTATSATTPGISQALTRTAGAYTFSVYAKAGTATWLRLNITTSGSATDRSAWFDLANGVVGSKGASVTIQQMTPAGNGWHRCGIVVTEAAVSETATIRLVSGNLAEDGTNGTTLDIWGAQWEIGTGITSYVPTTTAAVTRVLDVVSLAATAFPYNPTAFTWIAELTSRDLIGSAGVSTFVRQYTSTTDRVECVRSISANRLVMTTRAANVTTMTEIFVTGGFTVDVPHRLATTIDSVLGCACSFDGGATLVEPVPGTVPTNLLTLEFGNSPNNHFRKFVCLPRRAANSELPRMSNLLAPTLLPTLPPGIFDGDLRDRLPRPETLPTPAKRKRKT